MCARAHGQISILESALVEVEETTRTLCQTAKGDKLALENKMREMEAAMGKKINSLAESCDAATKKVSELNDLVKVVQIQQSGVESKFNDAFTQLNQLQQSVDSRFNENRIHWEDMDRLAASHTQEIEHSQMHLLEVDNRLCALEGSIANEEVRSLSNEKAILEAEQKAQNALLEINELSTKGLPKLIANVTGIA